MVGTYEYCLMPNSFWNIMILTYENFSESQVYLRKEQILNGKTPGEQQRHDLGAPQTGAAFV